ncbi:kinase-like domain-containing protein [Leucosporidium creatinivorum]|uniref:Kinase-like domain-containing protein n=1 Tax=Leucosporidium creatinivorum TaxID=106004 RepID=A0A1Y2G151_9BASI|nr:kinase-like domain-containing protein [Leucosporidium creatinivorum]
MLRRNSFRAREEDDKDWAIRPAVETVLENLDVFFPDVDLDKPVFDLPTPAPSTPSPVKEAGPSPPGVTERSASASSKSIRVVAQDRKRAMQKAGRNVVTAVSGLGSNLLRRKSTKLFGARIEEVTSAQLGRISTTIRESPDDDPQNFSYKWIKGDLIGRGTFGHVYIGFSVNTGETIAVKQVELPKSQHDKDDARTKGMVQSLKAEIELLKDLDHPNIVLYLGMEQTPEHLSIFLEYVPGGSVGRIVRTHGKFEENVIKFFTYQILEGLEYLHSLGILHRDMKADNILTDQDGMCKISDFGTSKKSTDIYSNNENMSMQGSIFWMAPEVIHNKNMGYSAKADIWSLGCILIEMFAGRRPWSDEEAIQAMFKLGAERLAPPVPPDVTLSPLAESFLNDCLQIDANDRPKAYQLRDNDFLKLESTWSFTQTDLYRYVLVLLARSNVDADSPPRRQMADDEARRRAISSHPSG